MLQRFDKLVALPKELCQLDRPDSAFGFYRVMHAKSAGTIWSPHTFSITGGQSLSYRPRS